MIEEKKYFIDTCVAIYLYEGMETKFSTKALSAIDKKDIWYSPFVSLELKYLEECSKIKSHKIVISFLEEVLCASQAQIGLSELIAQSLEESWTRDPFDRCIVAHAKMTESILITSDKKIQNNFNSCLI